MGVVDVLIACYSTTTVGNVLRFFANERVSRQCWLEVKGLYIERELTVRKLLHDRIVIDVFLHIELFTAKGFKGQCSMPLYRILSIVKYSVNTVKAGSISNSSRSN